ncbi:hypothetical protein [Desulfosarcina ovata]|uniref:Uncharacterized protein n=2 Tax=Desulfosarcina ovata TaxID=83564 RepID=A0A5K8A914_9BACT|nr:hypothetical protein [Desulfosarcina ovata]BBO81683.1 hypothetical protein DSCO28_22490 [Desulfosarcina ovata subsp. sediminis]BBO88918.1 hypothetical protein DSCOOX_20980 [Desulfosarcina ovata subsp. ovata]
MQKKVSLPTFTTDALTAVNNAVSMAEELVSNHYKMSASQWLHPKYDVKTLVDLNDTEIVDGPFAQIIRYEGKPDGGVLGSSTYDLYKICVQDHAILKVLNEHPEITLFPFALYVITHELIHIVRFSRFIQNFNATDVEKLTEEHRVHGITRDILDAVKAPPMHTVLTFYSTWHAPIDGLKSIL